MEKVDPKYRANTHWLLTHNIDPNLYWKWDNVPERPPGDFVGKREGFYAPGCKCQCKGCSDCGMSMCHCQCSTVRRMAAKCGHHSGKMLLIVLILIAAGVLVFANLDESEK
jgi:hypothetical protein